MYHRIQAYFADISPIWVDGSLKVLTALFGAVLLTFNNDDIYKYVGAYTVFWIKNLIEWLMTSTVALTLYRSTGYSDHLDAKEAAKNKVSGTVQTTQTMQVTEKVENNNETK